MKIKHGTRRPKLRRDKRIRLTQELIHLRAAANFFENSKGAAKGK